MEDVRMLQAEAKKGALHRTHRALTAKNASGDAARQNVSAKGKANRKDRRQNGFNIRNTDTAMGRALAAAMQGMTLDADNGGTGKKREQTHQGGSGAGASNAAKCVDRSRCRQQHIRQPEDSSRFCTGTPHPGQEKAGGRAWYWRDHADRYCKGAGKSLPVTPVRICPPDPAQRRAGYEGPKARHGVKGNRP